MIRLLHTADWQIGEHFGHVDAEAAVALTAARIDVVDRIGQMATERAVDVIVVAGDVFDFQAISEKSMRRMFNALSSYEGPWVFLPGNHDAALADSVWTRAQRMGCLPSNAHLCLAPEALLLADDRICILPAPLVQRHTTEDLTRWYADAESPAGAVRVGLAHGRFADVLPGDSDAKNVIAADAVQRGRLDYLALGDWHGSLQVGPKAWYSGTPETDRFVNNDSGNALIVALDPGAAPEVEKVRIGAFRWQTHDHALAVPSDVDQLVDRLAAVDRTDVVRLRCTGAVSLADLQRITLSAGQAEAKAHALVLDTSALQLLPTDEDFATLKADGYVATVLQELREGQQSPDAEQTQLNRDALEILARMLLDTDQGVEEMR